MSTIIYGMTRTDLLDAYRPMSEGWKRLPDGRMPAQDMLVFEVPAELVANLTPAQVAERVFIATNAPGLDAREEDGLLVELYAQWIEEDEYHPVAGPRYVGVGTPYRRALSVGDTVSVEGHPSVACDKRGWREIA